ncbi:MAG: hypothetical protein WBK97_03840 [Bacteroidales bacterium]|jgi:primosomal protein N'
MKEMYAHVLFPLALDSTFTYRIPPELAPAAVPGKQVTAPIGHRIQTGIITHISNTPHAPALEIKDILSIEEKLPVVPEKTLRFWHWIASYYLCPTGLVAKMAWSSWRFKRHAVSEFSKDNDETLLLKTPEKPLYLRHAQRTVFYKKEILKTITAGKQCLVLCPDKISCENTYHDFLQDQEDRVFCFHSKRSMKEQSTVKKELYAGNPCIVTGMHHALLLPFTRLGLIIVEQEEHPGHKRTDALPLFHARDTALYMGQLFGAQVILGSAISSLETFYNVQQKKYTTYPLNQEIPAAKAIVINTSLSYPAPTFKEMFDFRTKVLMDQCRAKGKKILLVTDTPNTIEQQEQEDTILCHSFQVHHHLNKEIGLVCFPDMDAFLANTHFRTTERAYQIIGNVLAYAALQQIPVPVCLQTSHTQHPLYEYLKESSSNPVFMSMLEERKQYNYPPYTRLLHITITHHRKSTARQKIQLLLSRLRESSAAMDCIGPFVPQTFPSPGFSYRLQCVLPRTNQAKVLKETIAAVIKDTPLAPAKYRVDVDPV